MRRGVAASGWCAGRDARSAAWVCLPSINWTRCGYSRGWLASKTDPQRARGIRERARASIRRLSAEFPGDAETGVLDAAVFDEGSEAEERFAEFANDEPCPVLDPETGLCDLYDARPMTCRTFGPPVRSEGGLGVANFTPCATGEQIAACEMVADPDDLESKLLRELEKTQGRRGSTMVAMREMKDKRLPRARRGPGWSGRGAVRVDGGGGVAVGEGVDRGPDNVDRVRMSLIALLRFRVNSACVVAAAGAWDGSCGNCWSQMRGRQ